ncbi:MAG: META domain-containing protein [Muribaculaceae bacterium]
MKKVLGFLFAAMIMVACSTHSAVNVDGEWVITNVNGKSTEGGDRQAEIMFDGKGKVNGNASVNSFFGSYSIEGDSLKFGPMGMTRMMGGSMEIEDAITKALGEVATVKIDGDKAVIMDAQGNEVMQLERKKK